MPACAGMTEPICALARDFNHAELTLKNRTATRLACELACRANVSCHADAHASKLTHERAARITAIWRSLLVAFLRLYEHTHR